MTPQESRLAVRSAVGGVRNEPREARRHIRVSRVPLHEIEKGLGPELLDMLRVVPQAEEMAAA